MHIESLLMIVPALQVGVAAVALTMSAYLMFSRLFSHVGRRLGSW
jgi:hypothetical protein